MKDFYRQKGAGKKKTRLRSGELMRSYFPSGIDKGLSGR